MNDDLVARVEEDIGKNFFLRVKTHPITNINYVEIRPGLFSWLWKNNKDRVHEYLERTLTEKIAAYCSEMGFSEELELREENYEDMLKKLLEFCPELPVIIFYRPRSEVEAEEMGMHILRIKHNANYNSPVIPAPV